MEKALGMGSDAIMLDLEDAVPAAERVPAREAVSAFIEKRGKEKSLFVRINGLDTSAVLADLLAVVSEGLTGVQVPKIESPEDIRLIHRLLDWIEEDRGIEIGKTIIWPILETAKAIKLGYEIASASERVAFQGASGGKGGDVERAIGSRWSAVGWESFTMRAQAIVDARAAGVIHPMTGIWSAVPDLEGLRAFAEVNRDLGYGGMVAIHPSHIATINEVFQVTDEELEYYKGLVDAMAEARSRGQSATVYRGEMVDTAHETTALQNLATYGKN
jgi:citrate lyase subunit beta / citryl-CoA lyase